MTKKVLVLRAWYLVCTNHHKKCNQRKDLSATQNEGSQQEGGLNFKPVAWYEFWNRRNTFVKWGKNLLFSFVISFKR